MIRNYLRIKISYSGSFEFCWFHRLATKWVYIYFIFMFQIIVITVISIILASLFNPLIALIKKWKIKRKSWIIDTILLALVLILADTYSSLSSSGYIWFIFDLIFILLILPIWFLFVRKVVYKFLGYEYVAIPFIWFLLTVWFIILNLFILTTIFHSKSPCFC